MKLIPVRVPEDIPKRLAVMLPLVQKQEAFASLRLTNADVLRMAIYEGLEVLEKANLPKRYNPEDR